MNLKEAIEIAKEKGFNWVAVDQDKSIVMYIEKPYINYFFYEWCSCGAYNHLITNHKYTGNKSWIKTLRKVSS